MFSNPCHCYLTQSHKMLILKLSISVIISISCSKVKLYLSETSDDKPRLENGSDYADHIENPFLGKPFLIRKSAKCSKVGADGRKRGNDKDMFH